MVRWCPPATTVPAEGRRAARRPGRPHGPTTPPLGRPVAGTESGNGGRTALGTPTRRGEPQAVHTRPGARSRRNG
ncbi:hypothetical protein SXIM_14360 [Streptomyces xiamenensis]|uniref:Uncharacterized protein n=1 Tax=Streptomyces xiamenensis TaxID=408015 RepID=A0A0F7FRG9_9ACTN|nr:hypothetical protein SXIM_14360 [Streptomyces xiamenensis]